MNNTGHSTKRNLIYNSEQKLLSNYIIYAQLNYCAKVNLDHTCRCWFSYIQRTRKVVSCVISSALCGTRPAGKEVRKEGKNLSPTNEVQSGRKWPRKQRKVVTAVGTVTQWARVEDRNFSLSSCRKGSSHEGINRTSNRMDKT